LPRIALASASSRLFLAPVALAGPAAAPPAVTQEQRPPLPSRPTGAPLSAPPSGTDAPAPGGRGGEGAQPDAHLADAGPTPQKPFHFTDRPLALEVTVGLGIPVGGFGGVVEYSIAPRIALGAGAGATWLDGWYGRIPGPIQVAALARYRLAVLEQGDDARAFDVVGALAAGRYIYPFFGGNENTPAVDEQAYWAQCALEYEVLNRGGFRFAMGLGAAYLVATGDVWRSGAGAQSQTTFAAPRLVPTFGLTFGLGL
jgi:hypothetical protein